MLNKNFWGKVKEDLSIWKRVSLPSYIIKGGLIKSSLNHWASHCQSFFASGASIGRALANLYYSSYYFSYCLVFFCLMCNEK